jgi:hypothetical protein
MLFLPQIEHPVFARKRANLLMVAVGVADRCGPESLRVTTIDGQRLLLRNDFSFTPGTRMVTEKGMPIVSTVIKGSRGYLRIDGR